MERSFDGEKVSGFIADFVGNEPVTGMIFDVDGTLLDSMPVWNQCVQRYLSDQGIAAEDGLEKILFSMTMQQGAAYMKQAYGLTELPEQLIAGINETVFAAYQHQIQPKPKVLPFLEALRQKKIPMTVVTSSDRTLVLAAFQRLGMTQYFGSVMTCSEFGSGKDRPEIFCAAAAGMGSPINTTWVVEDALYAVRTAKAAGFPVIGCADVSSSRDEEEIRGLADYFVSFE